MIVGNEMKERKFKSGADLEGASRDEHQGISRMPHSDVRVTAIHPTHSCCVLKPETRTSPGE